MLGAPDPIAASEEPPHVRDRRQAARHRAHQGPQGRPRRARRHLPLRRASASTRSSPTTWRCFAGTASIRSAPRPPRNPACQAHPRTPTATSCCGSSSPAASSAADQLRTIGRLAERYGRGMGDITTRQNVQLHWLTIEDLPVVLDELNAVGLSFTQACGDVWRNVVGCPLAGVDGHELIDSRPLIAELERTFVGDRRFSNLPRKFKVSVSGCLHRCAQHEINDIGLVAVEKDGVVGYDVWVGGGLGASARMGRRLDVFVAAGGGGRGVRGDHRDLPRRGQAQQADPGADQVPGRRVGGGALPRRDRGQARPRAADVGRPGPSRSIPTATTWASTRRRSTASTTSAARTLRGRFLADQMIGVADIADRYGSGAAALHQPPEHDRAGRARRARRGGRSRARRPRAADRGVRLPAGRSSPARAWSSASWRSSRPRSARRS